jgi:hypothetical protein
MVELDDARRKSLWIGIALVCGGVASLVAAIAGPLGAVQNIGRMAGLLLVFGVAKIRLALKAEDACAVPVTVYHSSGDSIPNTSQPIEVFATYCSNRAQIQALRQAARWMPDRGHA